MPSSLRDAFILERCLHPFSTHTLHTPAANDAPLPQGYALGAIRFRCSIAEGGASKITSVHFADALHVEKLRRDEEEHDYVSTAHLHKQNNKMIEIINMKRPGSAEDDGEEGEGGAGSRGRRKSGDDEDTCESALEILALPGSASGTPVGALSAEKKNPGVSPLACTSLLPD